jgi:predicted TIM-barrel fold metal-dependent hydrolase
MNMVDADSHVIEPPDLWESRVARAFRDRVPRVLEENANEWLVCEGRKLMSAGHLSGLSRGDRALPVDSTLLKGRWREDILPGAFEPAARLADMDTDGVDVAVIYPTVALAFYSLPDRSLVAELFRAYNRWLSELCSAAPSRLLGIAALVGDDPAAEVAEIESATAAGHAGFLIPLYDDRDADFAASRWDPLWAAAQERGLPVAFHAFVRGPGERSSVTEATMDAMVERPARVQRAILSMILAGVFDRFPGLKIVSAENEAGWAASMLERADTSFHRGRFGRPADGGIDRPPTDIFRDHVFLTILDDRTAVHARSVIGVDNLLWSSDYPHNVSTWPHSRRHIDGWISEAGVPEADAAKLLGDNARRLYGLPPALYNRSSVASSLTPSK